LGILLAAGLLLLLTACQSYEYRGTVVDDPQPAPPLVLDNVDGGTFDLAEHRGTIYLLYFGYTSCPDICPATLAQARQVFDQLGDQADQVRFLFVTVDPERDTPDILSTYIEVFHSNIIGLAGSQEALQAIFDDYGIVAEKEFIEDSAVGYVMNHTTRVFLIDQEGRLALSYSFGTPPEDMVQDIEHLLQ
jgi:protein SCO1/2